jgi:putative endonuclease
MVTPNVLRPVEEWRDPRHRRGLAGELAAARHLVATGWTVLAHRYRLGRHDLDLIARRDDLVAFIEVKTRQGDAFGGGRHAVGWRKRLVLELVASGWIADHGRAGESYRFDLMEVVWRDGQYPHVFHIEDAWRAVRK